MADEALIEQLCNGENVTAYLDGELDSLQSTAFERHARVCRDCAEQFQEQRRLLQTLDLAFAQGPPVPLPNNFGEIVTIQAQTDMSGVRERSENQIALVWSCLLCGLSLVLMGAPIAIESVWRPIRSIAQYAISLLSFSWRALSDAGTGAAVIARALGVRLRFDFFSLELPSILFLALAALLLTHFIRNYHRSEYAWEEARHRATSA